jgi:hypothetical protein
MVASAMSRTKKGAQGEALLSPIDQKDPLKGKKQVDA